MRQVTITELRRRSGVALADGRRTRLAYDFQGRTVQQADDDSGGEVHKLQQALGQAYFANRGYRIFPFQIGVRGVHAMADFAVVRYRRVILVECLVDPLPQSSWVKLMQAILTPPPSMEALAQQKIGHKRQIGEAVELWFIVEALGRSILKAMGYRCQILSNQRRLNTRFWICRERIRNLAT